MIRHWDKQNTERNKKKEREGKDRKKEGGGQEGKEFEFESKLDKQFEKENSQYGATSNRTWWVILNICVFS